MFTRRIKLFNLLGFPIYIDLSWFVIVILITWSLATQLFPRYYDVPTSVYWWMGLAGALGLFVSIVAHELGHAVVARRFDVPMKGITLFIFGGVAEMGQEPPSAKAEFFVAIGGPIVSVVLAGVFFLVSYLGEAAFPPPVDGVLWYLGFINAVVVAFNLIPAFPLDGGRILRGVLWHLKGNLRWATRITSSLGSGFGIFLIALGVISIIGGNVIGGGWQVLLGLFLRGAAQMSYQQVLIRRALEGEPVERFMRSDVNTVPPSVTISELVQDYVYKFHHKMFPVMDGEQLVGCITTREIQQIPQEEWNQRTVGDVLKPCGEENTIAHDADAMEALSSMNRSGASRLMVVRDGRLEGIVSLKDLMKFISLKVELEEEGSSGRGAIQSSDPDPQRAA